MDDIRYYSKVIFGRGCVADEWQAKNWNSIITIIVYIIKVEINSTVKMTHKGKSGLLYKIQFRVDIMVAEESHGCR